MTSLFNPMTTINKSTKPFEHPYKGIVVQVDPDPEYIGRIKVNIPEIFGEYIENDQGNTAGILPWIYPRYFGRFGGKFEFGVPDKGDIVEVEFPYRNPYLGYYTNKPMGKSIWDAISQLDPEEGKAIADRVKNSYPNVYGSIDRNLTGWYVDKATNEIFIVQGGKKCKVWFGPDGALNITSPTNIVLNAGASIVLNAGTSIEMTTADIASTGTWSHKGTLTSSGEGTFNNVTVSGHQHEYVKPAHPDGSDETEKPTPGT